MAITNWELITNENFVHGIDFSSGLNLVGSFCYATEITAGPALIAIKNKVVTDVANIKLQIYIRKQCANIEPFLFLRFDSVTGYAYVIKLENNINLYKLNITDITSIPPLSPIVQGTTPINANVTYRINFYCYTLIDQSTVFECSLFLNNTWVTEISHVMEPDIVSGDLGFGAYYKFGTILEGCTKAFFDNIEILSPIVFV
jgi:hypothetical protein